MADAAHVETSSTSVAITSSASGANASSILIVDISTSNTLNPEMARSVEELDDALAIPTGKRVSFSGDDLQEDDRYISAGEGEWNEDYNQNGNEINSDSVNGLLNESNAASLNEAVKPSTSGKGPLIPHSSKLPRYVVLGDRYRKAILPNSLAIADLNTQIAAKISNQAMLNIDGSNSADFKKIYTSSDHGYKELNHIFMWIHGVLPAGPYDANTINIHDTKSNEIPSNAENPKESALIHPPVVHFEKIDFDLPRADFPSPTLNGERPTTTDAFTPETRMLRKRNVDYIRGKSVSSVKAECSRLATNSAIPSCLRTEHRAPKTDDKAITKKQSYKRIVKLKGLISFQIPNELFLITQDNIQSPSAVMNEVLELDLSRMVRLVGPSNSGQGRLATGKSKRQLKSIIKIRAKRTPHLMAHTSVTEWPHHNTQYVLTSHDHISEGLVDDEKFSIKAAAIKEFSKRSKKIMPRISYPDLSPEYKAKQREIRRQLQKERVRTPPPEMPVNPYAHLPLQFPALNPVHILIVNSFLSLKCNVSIIQAGFRGFMQRKTNMLKLTLVVWIQRKWRAMLVARKFREVRNAKRKADKTQILEALYKLDERASITASGVSKALCQDSRLHRNMHCGTLKTDGTGSGNSIKPEALQLKVMFTDRQNSIDKKFKSNFPLRSIMLEMSWRKHKTDQKSLAQLNEGSTNRKPTSGNEICDFILAQYNNFKGIYVKAFTTAIHTKPKPEPLFADKVPLWSPPYHIFPFLSRADLENLLPILGFVPGSAKTKGSKGKK